MQNTELTFIRNNMAISGNNLVGEVDLIEEINKNTHNIWEIKCVSDISLKHVLQVVMYNIIYHKLYETINEKKYIINTNFINFLKGEIFQLEVNLTSIQIKRIIEIFMQN